MKPPQQTHNPAGPEGPHFPRIHPRLRTGRGHIMRFLTGQGAAEGLLIAVPALALLSLVELQRTPQNLPSPLAGAAVVTACMGLGILQRWRMHGGQWARIWDHCQNGDGLIETLCFLEQAPTSSDEWQRSLQDQTDRISPPSRAELRRLLTPSQTSAARGPALIALILVISWFLLLTEGFSDTRPGGETAPSVAGVPGTASSDSVTSTAPESTDETTGTVQLQENGAGKPPSDPASASNIPATEENTLTTLEGGENRLAESPVDPRALTSEAATTAISASAPSAGDASSAPLGGSRQEAPFRAETPAAGGQDERSPNQRVPAQRSSEDLRSLTADSASGTGVASPAQDSEKPAAPVSVPTSEAQSGPLDYPPHWQKLVDRYMKLRDRTPSGAGKR